MSDEARNFRDPDLKIHSRVVVTVYSDRSWTGIIVGEARDGHAWQIIKDGTKWPKGIHKSFCKAEKTDRMMRD
jgi:hypothetical protein